MLQSEFETHTDIFPDVLLYDAADHEYMTGDWDSKAGFCHDFKFNVDGIAQKCQRIANERWAKVNEEISRLRSSVMPITDECERLRTKNSRLEDENENLRNEIADMAKTVDNLIQQIAELKPQGFTSEQIRIAIQQSFCNAAHDDNCADMILHMVWGFDYLLENLGVE